MKRLLCTALAMLMAVSTLMLTFPVLAEEAQVVFSFNYSDKNNGTVDNQASATVTKGDKSRGEVALKVVANPDGVGKGVYLDCYSINYPAEELSRVRYVTVRYRYEAAEETRCADRMRVGLMKNGGALVTSLFVDSEDSLVVGEWATAPFDFTALKTSVQTGEGKVFRQFHLFPFGDIPLSDTSDSETMYISEIAFLSGNPDPNAEYAVDFRSSNPDAEGENPDSLSVKRGEEYTLPRCPYTLKGGIFKGWRSSSDSRLYGEGDRIIAEDGDVTYTAELEYTDGEGVKVLDFTTYFNGIVDRKLSATAEKVTFDGATAVRIVPNPDYEVADYSVYLDGYTYLGAKIDLTKYKYMAVSYYLDTPSLPKETGMQINLMRNGGVLTSTYGAPVTNSLVCGRWAYALTDISGVTEKLNPSRTDDFIRQIHIIPFASYKTPDFTGEETLYIGRLLFFTEKPSLAVHGAYMKGYSDGTFKPQGNITRAEACAVIARLSAGSDSLVPTNKSTSFTDVGDSDWHHRYISYIESLGYLKSYSGEFLPDKPITRAEFVELVYSMGLLKDAGGNGNFTDVAQDHPRASVISAAGKAGLVNGYANGDGTFSFRPDATITRAEVVRVVNNAFGRSISADRLSTDVSFCFLDVEPDFWAYADICEAALSHMTDGGRWLYAITNPAALMQGSAAPDLEAGVAYLAELDRLSEERRTAILGSETELTVTGTSYYVDAATGDDGNDGRSPERAWRTVGRVNEASLKAGDGVFFKRGDLYRERLSTKPGVTYSAYGIGEKPRFYGSPENGADPSKWTLLEGTDSIWVYATETVDVGTIFLDGKTAALKEIPDLKGGVHYVRQTDKVFDVAAELSENLEFYCDIRSTDLGRSKGKIYLRCDGGNPGEVYDDIEFNTRGNVISVGGNGITLDNLCVMYGGSHGIGSGTVKNLTVRNCTVGRIGGSIQHYNDNGTVTRFGNGIEIYGGCDGYTVDNCYIYQCYDAGVTHQYSARSGGGVDISMYNITYSNNLIEDCTYSVEYFNDNSPSSADIRDGKNFRIFGNIMRRAGYGFGKQRITNASSHLKGWDTRNEYEKGTFVIENNVFDRGKWSLIQTQADYDSWCPIYSGNTYVQQLGGPLGYNKGDEYMLFDNLAEITVKQKLGDSTGKVYWLPEHLRCNAECKVQNAK